METDKDHIHILLNFTPQFSISSIVNPLKSTSTVRIFKATFLGKYTSWSDGYFVCSIGEANSHTIRNYIATPC
jgi:putative transposase